MKEIKIQLDEDSPVSFSMPQKWSELPYSKILKIHQAIDLYSLNPAKGLEVLLIAFNLSKFPVSKSKRQQVKVLKALSGEWLHTLLKDPDFLGWIFTPNGAADYPIKKFTHKWFTYYGPPRKLLDLKTIEIIAAHQMFVDYHNKKDIIYLNKLVALLFRPARFFHKIEALFPSFNRDIRVKLNPYHWEKRGGKMDSIPFGLKMSILRMFSSEWQIFENRFPHVFPKSSKASGKQDPQLWTKILIHLSGKEFGTLEETKMQAGAEVFLKLDMSIKEAQDAKDRIKNMKK